MKNIQKPAGFWIRILSILIDLIIFSIIAISASLIAIEKNNNELLIIPINYYIWMLLVIFEIITLFIVIPVIFKTKTIGMMICQISMISLSQEKMWFMILKKNQVYSFLWIFSIILSMSFIDPKLAQKMVTISNQTDSKVVLEVWEKVLLSIPSTTSGIIIFVNLFITLSINISKDMRSINDKVTNTQIVYTRKLIEVFDEQVKVIAREKVKKEKIIWKE